MWEYVMLKKIVWFALNEIRMMKDIEQEFTEIFDLTNQKCILMIAL